MCPLATKIAARVNRDSNLQLYSFVDVGQGKRIRPDRVPVRGHARELFKRKLSRDIRARRTRISLDVHSHSRPVALHLIKLSKSPLPPLLPTFLHSEPFVSLFGDIHRDFYWGFIFIETRFK